MRSDKFLGIVDGYRVYQNGRGYASIVFGRSDEKLLHIYLMEKHLGCSLEGKIVHHKDGNRLNNSLDNLLVLNNDQEHATIHANERLQRLGGTPGIHKYCPKCQTVKTLEDFPRSKNNYDGRYGFCKKCAVIHVRQMRLKRKANG